MNTSTSHFFDTTILDPSISSSAPYSAPAKVAPKSKASQVPMMSASLWRHTVNECETARRHGLVVRSLCGLLGVLSLASVAAAAWQTHALFSGNHLHEAISAFLH